MSTQEQEGGYRMVTPHGQVSFNEQEGIELLNFLSTQGKEYLASGTQQARSAWGKIESDILSNVPARS